MELKKGKVAVLFAAAAVVVSTACVDVSASNDAVAFTNYRLKAGYANTYTTSRYRQTTNPNNKWKVNLAYSTEGKGSIATFWLAKANSAHTLVSGTHNVAQGSGNHYFAATSGASRSNVCLGMENNNYTPHEYKVSGYWDEETD